MGVEAAGSDVVITGSGEQTILIPINRVYSIEVTVEYDKEYGEGDLPSVVLLDSDGTTEIETKTVEGGPEQPHTITFWRVRGPRSVKYVSAASGAESIVRFSLPKVFWSERSAKSKGFQTSTLMIDSGIPEVEEVKTKKAKKVEKVEKAEKVEKVEKTWGG
jgi:hypothetical protein